MEILVRYLNPFCDCVYNHERVGMFFIILRVEVAANQLSMLLKLFGKLLGTRADPKEKKGGQKMFRGKKEQ